MDFKKVIIDTHDGDTILTLKKVVPIRLLKNKFGCEVSIMEEQGATFDMLNDLLGTGRL